jgi:hypothetical protein
VKFQEFPVLTRYTGRDLPVHTNLRRRTVVWKLGALPNKTISEGFMQSLAAQGEAYVDHKLHIAHLVIEDLACRRSGVSLEALYGTVRGKDRVVFARHLYVYLWHQQLAGSISGTAQVVGRDRRMVAYAIGRIEERRDSDPAFDRTVDLYVAEARRLIVHAQCRFALRLSSPPATPDLAPECLSPPRSHLTCTVSWPG